MKPRAALGKVKRRAVAAVPVRDPLRGSDPVALYARFLDGEHLWLTVARATSLALRLPDGGLHALDAEPARDGGVNVLSVRLDVAALLAGRDDDTLDLPLVETSGSPQPVRHAATRRKGPALPAPTTADRRWQFSVAADDGRVVVRRRPADPAVEVLDFAVTADAVEVRLSTDTGTARLMSEQDTEAARLPVADGILRLTDDVAPPLGRTLQVLLDDVPVMRRRNYLGNPQQAVMLPTLPGGTEVRWVSGGRLALHTKVEEQTA